MSGEGQNGDRLNRQIKATEAYANLTRDVADFRRELLGDGSGGILNEIRDDLKGLKANPMVRLGLAFNTTRRAVVAVLGVIAGAVAIGAGIRQILT